MLRVRLPGAVRAMRTTPVITRIGDSVAPCPRVSVSFRRSGRDLAAGKVECGPCNGQAERAADLSQEKRPTVADEPLLKVVP
ncbi:hypothetical protein GCM10022222_15820 [Amycolatopsis ultiminotia]|uniref:Uncharacterized protein n=1 Tax=Amycolatopsis ultiminotia TaxID=543629 RepID=A0ABP6VFW6_9PSEU